MRFYGYFEGDVGLPAWCRDSIFLAMEYFPLGDLYRVLTASESSGATEEDARYIASQLLYCLQIMHGLGITHRDLKPQVCPIQFQGSGPLMVFLRISSLFNGIPFGGSNSETLVFQRQFSKESCPLELGPSAMWLQN